MSSLVTDSVAVCVALQSAPVRMMERSIYSAKNIFVENLFKRYVITAKSSCGHVWDSAAGCVRPRLGERMVLLKHYRTETTDPGLQTTN